MYLAAIFFRKIQIDLLFHPCRAPSFLIKFFNYNILKESRALLKINTPIEVENGPKIGRTIPEKAGRFFGDDVPSCSRLLIPGLDGGNPAPSSLAFTPSRSSSGPARTLRRGTSLS